jgi:RNA polymerase sigma factor (sigma-70 family)
VGATDDVSREDAWQSFVAEYSRLILHVAWSETDSHDVAMDRYAFVLEQLRADGFRRLRSFGTEGRGKFTTWLVVVARRLCLDEARRRYGRNRGAPERHRERRRLSDLVAAEVQLESLVDEAGPLPDEEIHHAQLGHALGTAIDQLDPSDRLLLRLRFQDDVPVAEIARLLSLPSVFHVYRRLNRVYDQLRKTLQGLGVEDAAP